MSALFLYGYETEDVSALLWERFGNFYEWKKQLRRRPVGI